ncbi:MAG: MFS transporter [Betaproteobacteria bacterium]|nr:MFS transporter [Betaproteobacteria bacterium]MDH5288354.1 MFS transporter [Betaproteobacteria bacterium]
MRANTDAAPVGAGPAWLDRRVAGWALYDVASSSYIAIVPLLFPLLFATVLDGAPRADAHFALLGALSLVVAGVAAPLIGALADRGRLLTWLAAATAVCCAACAAMPSLRTGDVLFASLAFVAAQCGYTVAMVLYESFLPRLATASAMARVSAFGWAAGLCGGLLALAIALAVARGRPDAEAAALAIGVAAVVFALLALPALGALRGIAPARLASRPATLRDAWRTIVDDLRGWRRHRNSARFLLAYLLINDASVTVVFVVSLFMRSTFGTTVEGLLLLVLLYNVIAAPATLAWGRVADRIGLKLAIHLNLVVWIAGILLMAYARDDRMPWLIVATFALVMASTNALCRALYARLVPVERSAQFFGFNAIVGRVSAALGPATYAAVTTWTGSSVAGLLSLLAFIVAGGVVLVFVDTTPVVVSMDDAREEAQT